MSTAASKNAAEDTAAEEPQFLEHEIDYLENASNASHIAAEEEVGSNHEDDEETEDGDEEEATYHCGECAMDFSVLDEHIRQYHKDSDVIVKDEATDPLSLEDSLECTLCDYVFASGVDRDIHYQVQHDVESVSRPAKMLVKRTANRPATSASAKRAKPSDRAAEEEDASDADFEVAGEKQSVAATKSLRGPNRKKREVSNKPKDPVHCDECNTTFPSMKNLKLHMRIHLPVRAITLDDAINYNEQHLGPAARSSKPAEDSTAALEDAATDDEATAAVTDDAAKFHCDICQKSYGLEYEEIHRQSHAANANDQPRCISCNIFFASAELLQLHQAAHRERTFRVHDRGNLPLPYACGYCGKAFARPHEKVKHERIHTGEKPHACEICGKTFRVAFCLTLHMRSHTDARPYVCPHCNKRYKSQSVYSHHLQTHSDARPYLCPYCPKAFKTAVQQAGHKNSHTKPYPCSQCNRPFSTLYAVKLHLATHETKQHTLKHSCRICGAAYTRQFAVKQHMQEMHASELELQPADDGGEMAGDGGSPAGPSSRRKAVKSELELQLGDDDGGDEAEIDESLMMVDEEELQELQQHSGDGEGADAVATICKVEELQHHAGIVGGSEMELVVGGGDEIVEHFVGEEIVVDWMK